MFIPIPIRDRNFIHSITTSNNYKKLWLGWKQNRCTHSVVKTSTIVAVAITCGKEVVIIKAFIPHIWCVTFLSGMCNTKVRINMQTTINLIIVLFCCWQTPTGNFSNNLVQLQKKQFCRNDMKRFQNKNGCRLQYSIHYLFLYTDLPISSPHLRDKTFIHMN
jgi:hypothetical protein